MNDTLGWVDHRPSLTQIEPATDEQIAMWEADMDGTPWSDGHIERLIARIRETRMLLQYERDLRAAEVDHIRTTTIRECAAIARNSWPWKNMNETAFAVAQGASCRILSLLEPKENSK